MKNMSKLINNINKGRIPNVSLKGFTLVELMIVIFVIAILMAITLPAYQAYAKKAARSQAQQEVLKLAEQLEKHKVKNYTYQGFNPAFMYGETSEMSDITIPRGASGDRIKYIIHIRDLNDTTQSLTSKDVRGLGWVILAESKDSENHNLLINSSGLRCSTTNSIGFGSCGTGNKVETW
jgi:type IV pilus assembly protein PilE